MTVPELRSKRADLIKQAREIVDGAEAAGRADLNGDEKRRYDELMAKIDELGKRIEREEKLQGLEAGLTQSLGRVTESSDPGGGSQQRDRPRFVDLKTGHEVRVLAPADRWPSGAGEQEDISLARMVRGYLTGQWDGASAGERRAVVGAEGTGMLGGFLVPEGVASAIINAMRTQLRVIQAGAYTVVMERPELTMAKVATEPQAYWVPENDPGTMSDLTFEPVTLRAKKLVALVKFSEELLADAANFEPALRDSLAFALTRELDRAALTGSGTGEPLGVLNTDGIGVTDLAGNPATIDTLMDVVFALVSLNVEQGHLAAIYNADFAKAIAKLKDGEGQYIESTAPPAWTGLRKLVSAQIPTASGKTNAYVGSFGDLYIGMRSQMTLQFSREASDEAGASAFLRSQVWARATMRVDSVTVRPPAFHVLKNAEV